MQNELADRSTVRTTVATEFVEICWRHKTNSSIFKDWHISKFIRQRILLGTEHKKNKVNRVLYKQQQTCGEEQKLITPVCIPTQCLIMHIACISLPSHSYMHLTFDYWVVGVLDIWVFLGVVWCFFCLYFLETPGMTFIPENWGNPTPKQPGHN